MVVCSNDYLDQFYGKVSFGNIGVYIGKSENNGYFVNYCSLRPESWQKQTSNEEPKVIEISKLVCSIWDSSPS